MHPGRLLLIAVLLVSALLAPPVFAEPYPPTADASLECLAAPADIQDAELPFVQAGCCYGNGGVCGCSAFGPVMCCDGRLSPTCMCRDGSPVTTLASIPR
jgi:hypothetical protein